MGGAHKTCFLDKNADHLTEEGISLRQQKSLLDSTRSFCKVPGATQSSCTKRLLQIEVCLCGDSLISFSNSIHGI